MKELDGPAPILAETMRWRRAVRRGAVVERVVDAVVRPGDTVLDIGAAQGLFTARLLGLVGRTGAVHAFEPNPMHADRLRQMARRRPGLVLHTVALSNRTGTAQLMVPVLDGAQNPGLGSLEDLHRKMTAEVDTIDVPVTTLDDVLGDRRVAFIKCDVEGHEDEVLAGAATTLGHLPTILIEIEHRHRRTEPQVMIDRLTTLGLQGWAAFSDGLRPVSEFDLERDQLRHVRSAPVDAMPREYVNDFLFTPPNVDVGRFVVG